MTFESTVGLSRSALSLDLFFLDLKDNLVVDLTDAVFSSRGASVKWASPGVRPLCCVSSELKLTGDSCGRLL